MKQREPLMGLESTTYRHPLIRSQTRYTLRHTPNDYDVLTYNYESCTFDITINNKKHK